MRLLYNKITWILSFQLLIYQIFRFLSLNSPWLSHRAWCNLLQWCLNLNSNSQDFSLLLLIPTKICRLHHSLNIPSILIQTIPKGIHQSLTIKHRNSINLELLLLTHLIWFNQVCRCRITIKTLHCPLNHLHHLPQMSIKKKKKRKSERSQQSRLKRRKG